MESAQHCSGGEMEVGQEFLDTSITDETSEKCFICFGSLASQQVARPENCTHCFCRQCIMEWSKENNTCPVDRIAYNYIFEMDYPEGKAKNKIKIVRPWRHLQADIVEQVTCEACGRSDDEHLIVICSACEIGYHRGCLSPPLPEAPVQEWLCQECRDNSVLLSEERTTVSDDEIADILAEAVPTSSRLRLSTLTSVHNTGGRRSSKRLRAQANNAAQHQPQSAQHVPKYLLKATRPTEASKASSSTDTPTTTSAAKTE